MVNPARAGQGLVEQLIGGATHGSFRRDHLAGLGDLAFKLGDEASEYRDRHVLDLRLFRRRRNDDIVKVHTPPPTRPRQCAARGLRLLV